MKLDFSRHIFKKKKNSNTKFFLKIRRVGTEMFHADVRTDMTKLIVAFHSFANAPSNGIPNLKKGVIIPINCIYRLAFVIEVVVFSVKKKLNSWIWFRRISSLQKGRAYLRPSVIFISLWGPVAFLVQAIRDLWNTKVTLGQDFLQVLGNHGTQISNMITPPHHAPSHDNTLTGEY